MRMVLVAALVIVVRTRPGPETSGTQTSDAPLKLETSSDIFSGSVIELLPDSITVTRKTAGKDTVTLKFSLDGNTRVEGQLKLNARVTVRYERSADTESIHALHIIVR